MTTRRLFWTQQGSCMHEFTGGDTACKEPWTLELPHPRFCECIDACMCTYMVVCIWGVVSVWYMYLLVWVCAHMPTAHVCGCLWLPDASIECLFHICLLFGGEGDEVLQSFTELDAHQFNWAGWSMNCRDPPICVLSLALRLCTNAAKCGFVQRVLGIQT